MGRSGGRVIVCSKKISSCLKVIQFCSEMVYALFGKMIKVRRRSLRQNSLGWNVFIYWLSEEPPDKIRQTPSLRFFPFCFVSCSAWASKRVPNRSETSTRASKRTPNRAEILTRASKRALNREPEAVHWKHSWRVVCADNQTAPSWILITQKSNLVVRYECRDELIVKYLSQHVSIRIQGWHNSMQWNRHRWNLLDETYRFRLQGDLETTRQISCFQILLDSKTIGLVEKIPTMPVSLHWVMPALNSYWNVLRYVFNN